MGVVTFFIVWGWNKAAASLDCQWAQWWDFEKTEQRGGVAVWQHAGHV